MHYQLQTENQADWNEIAKCMGGKQWSWNPSCIQLFTVAGKMLFILNSY